jgi:hypothetical protein
VPWSKQEHQNTMMSIEVDKHRGGTIRTGRPVSLRHRPARAEEIGMITVAELQSLEGSVVAIARGLTAELRVDNTGTAILFESVSGALAVVRVATDVTPATDVLALCPAELDRVFADAA